MAEEILKAYVDEYGNRPRTANELLQYAKKVGKNLGYGDAKKIIDGSKGNKKEKVGSQPQYAIGDLVLMTKDRHAIIRYIGQVPEMGDNNMYYGVELIDGTVGQSDGIIKGKRYFKTDGNRAMFVPIDKIRRIMTAKDHKRQDSYSKLHSSIASIKEQNPGNPNGDSNGNDNPNDNDDNVNNDLTDILSVVEVDVKSDNKSNAEQSIIQSLEQAEEKQDREQTDESNGNQVHKKTQSKSNITNNDNNANHERKRSSQSQSQTQTQRLSQSKGQPQQDAQQSHNNDDNTFEFVNYNDTILRYTMQQTNEYIQNQLYDLYCNPSTHTILIDAFNELKSISDYNKQKILWVALFKRWQKFIQ